MLVPSKDSNAISEAISKLISDPELAKALGDNGLKIFHEKFAADRMIKRYEESF